MSNLSPSTLALLRAAKNDAPSKESRNAIWGGVTSGLVTHTPLHITPQASAGSAGNVGASIAPQAAAAAATAKGGVLIGTSLTGMKGAFIGALFGSALSIGVATFMLRAKPADVPRAPLSAQATTTQVGDTSKANASNSVSTATQTGSTSAPSTSDVQELDALLPNAPAATKSGSSQNLGTSAIAVDSLTKSSSAQSGATSSNAKSMTDEAQSLRSKKSATSTSDLSPEDMLTREVSLVQEARRDLQNGDAASALKTVRAARSLEARQLEPEEMSLEAKALHLLGRHLEAAKIESQRRTMYPNAL